MKSLIDNLFRIIAPLALAVFMPAATILGQRLVSEDRFAYFKDYPTWAFVLLSVVSFLLICYVLIRWWKVRHDESHALPAFARTTGFLNGYMFVDYFIHEKVKWKIMVPSPRGIMERATMTSYDPEDIEVECPPLCPKCSTELYEEASFLLGGYWWKCPKKDFSRHCSNSIYYEADMAKRKAKSTLHGDKMTLR